MFRSGRLRSNAARASGSHDTEQPSRGDQQGKGTAGLRNGQDLRNGELDRFVRSPLYSRRDDQKPGTHEDSGAGMLKQLFAFEGTIERREYIIFMIVGWVLGILAAPISGLIPVLGIVTVVAAIWILFATMTKRLRGAGMSPWKSLVLLVPLVNIIAAIILAFPSADERAATPDAQ
jgi:hypothetical protein